MAARLDSMSSRAAAARRAGDREAPATTPKPPTPNVDERRELPVRTLGGAMASWLALSFGLCYVLLPWLAAATGVNSNLVRTFWFDLPAFAMASFVAIIAVLVERPRIDLTSHARDPWLAATLGGFGVWALITNASIYLTPFAAMSSLELGSLLGVKVVEMSLLGMMFASLTRRSDVALALGGGFQLGMFGLLLTLASLAV